MKCPAHVEAAIIGHARRDHPAECCGLLIGNEEVIVDAVPTSNASESPERRYLVDPQTYFDTIRLARRRSLQVIGVYHSHPHSTAAPSATDAAEGFTHFIFLIVGLATDPPELTAWIWADGNFEALPLVRVT